MNKPRVYQYGYDINEINKQIYIPETRVTSGDGDYFRCVLNNEHYGLAQAYLKEDSIFSFNPSDFSDREVLIYVETGEINVKTNNLKPQDTLLFQASQFKEPIDIEIKEPSVIYFFSGPPTSDDLRDGLMKKSSVFNFRNQDWADVLWTMVNREFCGKKIFLKKGNNSSFHFHCKKQETYFVHSGKLLLRLRAGKGEDKFFVLGPGQAVDIVPGLIHQAGGLEDTIIMEVSTRDYDTDAFLVESEFTKMPNIDLSPKNKTLKLFLDTADLTEVEEGLKKKILSGIILRAGITASDYLAKVSAAIKLCKNYDQNPLIFIENQEIIKELEYENLVVEMPINWEGVAAIKEFSRNNVQVACSLGMNEAQAVLAASAGARYFFLQISRIKDLGGDPSLIIKKSRKLLKDFDIEIIASDIRSNSIRDVIDAFLAGADAVAAPLNILEKMASHPKTTENIIRFVNSFLQWGKK